MFCQSLVHCIDDFLFVGGESKALFTEGYTFLGLEEKASKAMDGHIIGVTCIELDTKMESRLPADKYESISRSSASPSAWSNIPKHTWRAFILHTSNLVVRSFRRNLFKFLFLQSVSQILPLSIRSLQFKQRWIYAGGPPSFRIGPEDAGWTKGIGDWWQSHVFAKNITAALEEGYKLERGICHYVCIGEMGENLEGVSHSFHVRQLHY
jgi:hypothetical protein